MSETVEPALSATAQLSLSNPNAPRLFTPAMLRAVQALVRINLEARSKGLDVDRRRIADAVGAYAPDLRDLEAALSRVLPPTPTETPE